MTRKCPRCEVPWPDDVQFCPHDGTPLTRASRGSDGGHVSSSAEFGVWEAESYDVGDRLGAYKLVELLGEGGMGDVFRATHELLGRQVAIKALLPELSRHPEIVRRFFREAQAVNRIRHPNIIDITDFEEGGERPPYMVMELIKGESLSHYIHHNAPLPARRTMAIAAQICDAVAAVHEMGIVHRDLKPDNVMLVEEPDGSLRPKLLDFGIAKFMATEDAFLKTRTGELIGTAEYMAPEQIRGLKVDHRIDIYAMGIMLYEMLTGRPPFRGTLNTLLMSHLNEPPGPPSTLLDPDAPQIPAALEEVVVRCLAKKPEDRVQSMGQLGEILEWAAEDETTGVIVLTDVPRPPRPRWLWAVAGVGLLCLAWVLVWALGFKGGDSPSAASKRAATSRRDRKPQAGPMAAARPVPTFRRLKVVSRPSGASIYRLEDGKFMGLAPVEVQISKGRQETFAVQLEGHRQSKVTVSFSTASPVRVLLTPKGRGRAPSGLPARVSGAASAGKTRPKRRRARPSARKYGTFNPFD